MAAASILRAIEGAAFIGGLALLARLVRVRFMGGPTQGVVGLLGALTARIHGVRRQASAEAMARAWQTAFASPELVPIARVEGDTAFAEIRVSCPLRGSSDLEACYRLMEFDRRIAGRAGATFIVLRSQAEPGVTVCQVALRAQGLPAADLVPAHERCTSKKA